VEQLLAAVNAERTAAGCAALTVDEGLASAASEHSAAMRDDDLVDVRSAEDGPPLDRGGRTAVVAGGTDPVAVAAGWLGDADDRAALLDCGLTTAGAATDDGFWTLVAS
jgi:uncharacterized protein YkwD